MNNEFIDVDFKDVEGKKAHKTFLIIFCAILALILGVLGYLGFKNFYLSKPINVYKSLIDASVKKISNSLDSTYENIYIESNATFKASGLIYDMLGITEYSKYKFGLKSGVNQTNKTLEGGFYLTDTTLQKNNTAEVNLYYKDERAYLDFGNAYDKIIDLGKDESVLEGIEDLNKFLKQDEYNEKTTYLLNKVSDLFMSSLDEKDFSKEKSEIEINKIKHTVTSNKYIFNEKNLKKTKNIILEGLLNDEKSIKYLSELMNINENEVKKSLNEEINNNENMLQNNETYEMHIYSKGINSEIIGISLSSNINNELKELMHMYYLDKNIDFKVDESFKILGTFDINSDIEIYFYNFENKNYTKISTIKLLKYDKNNLKFDFKIEGIEEETLINLTGTFDSQNTNKEDKKLNKTIISVDSNIESITSSITFTIDTETYSKTDLAIFDQEKVIDISKVDQEKLESKLLKYYSKFDILSFLTNTEE